ncbi:MAG: hypothetical protein E3J72_20960 [Planctomycetota bacterium]|nr:MAG: hypothetical protein E3J72_20960 [Planctomycetota bacterium]
MPEWSLFGKFVCDKTAETVTFISAGMGFVAAVDGSVFSVTFGAENPPAGRMKSQIFHIKLINPIIIKICLRFSLLGKFLESR